MASLSSKRHSRRGGFTLLELLVVIGIILVLIGLFFAGAKVVTGQAKEKDTKNMLETCKTMFANYQQATRLARILSAYPVTVPPGTVAGIINLSASNTASLTTASYWKYAQESAPGTEATNTFPGTSISPDVLHLADPNITDRPAAIAYPHVPLAVANTEIVMEAMLTIPENQTILNNLPSNRVIKDAVTGIPLILDGWGNPILFCPAGGLASVFINPNDTPTPGQSQVQTSDGVKVYGWDPMNTTYVPAGTPISNQPFFVSAGPDGDIANVHGHAITTAATGATITAPAPSDISDDNIYSFNN